MADIEQARAEVLAFAKRLGDVLRRTQRYGGNGGDSGTFYDENRAHQDLNQACVAYAKSLDEKKE